MKQILVLLIVVLAARTQGAYNPLDAFRDMKAQKGAPIVQRPLVPPAVRVPDSKELRKYQGCPGIAVAANGRMWAAYFVGTTPDEDPRSAAVLATSADGGKTWKEVLMADPDGPGPLRAFDCNVFIAPDGRLWWYWCDRLASATAYVGDARTEQLWMVQIDSDREPDAAHLPVPRFVTYGHMISKPTVLANGSIALPIAHWWKREMGELMITEDGGKTFATRGAACHPKSGGACTEHLFVEKRNGDIVQWMRCREGIAETVSKDGGRTWSETVPVPGLRHTCSRFVFMKLASGRWLMVKHGEVNEDCGRTKLMAFLSDDEGRTWKGGLLLGKGSYPDAWQTADGKICVIVDRGRCQVKKACLCWYAFTEDEILAGGETEGREFMVRMMTAHEHPVRWDLAKVEPRSALVTDVKAPGADKTNAFEFASEHWLQVVRGDSRTILAGATALDPKKPVLFEILGENGEAICSRVVESKRGRTLAMDLGTNRIYTLHAVGGPGRWTDMRFDYEPRFGEIEKNATFFMEPLATWHGETLKKNPPWENPFVYELNRRAPAAQRNHDPKRTLSLNGPWQAAFAPTPDAAPGAWREVTVPCTSETVGLGTPQMCGYNYFIAKDPPYVLHSPLKELAPNQESAFSRREPNGTVRWKRSVDLPADWFEGRRPVLRFEGFGDGLYVRVNGRDVGYAEDGRAGAEFDLSGAAKPGTNEIEVKTLRLTDGSYLQDQDYWRLSGLYRGVSVFAEPLTCLADHFVRTTLASGPHEGGTWRLADAVRVAGPGAAGATVEAELTDGGKAIGRATAKVGPSGAATLALDVKAPTLWNAENPHLYDLKLVLRDAGGRTLDELTRTVGFREIVRDGAVFRVNGKAIKFLGTNLHEFNAKTGYTQTHEDRLRDAYIAKRMNCNALRFSHYPHDPDWYDIANRLGFYVIDEANCETHGLSGMGAARRVWRGLVGGALNPFADPRWQAAVMDRNRMMFERDKNEPCVLIWSVGNENMCRSDFFDELYDWFHAADPGRYVMNQSNGRIGAKMDFRDSMYARYWVLEHYAKSNPKCPFIVCEYAHQQGNSFGSFDGYQEAFRKYDCLQGGCLWDFVDQGLVVKDPATGKDVYWYRGEWFPGQGHAGEGSQNGTLRYDRTPNPWVRDVQHAFQPASVAALDLAAGRFVVTNWTYWTDLAAYELKYRVEDDGAEVASGTVGRLAVPPQAVREFSIAGIPPARAKLLRTWTFSLCRTKDAPWAPKGSEVGFEQIVLRTGDLPDTQPVASASDAISPALARIAAEIRPVLWRTPLVTMPMANTADRRRSQHAKTWKYADIDRVWRPASEKPTVTSVTTNGAVVRTDYAYPTAGKTTGTMEIETRPDGSLRCSFVLRPDVAAKLPPIPRIGLGFSLPRAYREAAWFGRGPGENYPNRCSTAFFGRWRLPIAGLFERYGKPQHCGERGDVFSLAFSGDGVPTLDLAAEKRPFHFNCLGYTEAELERKIHTEELEPSPDWNAVIDGFVTGTSGVSGGIEWEYVLYAEREYAFSFVFQSPRK